MGKGVFSGVICGKDVWYFCLAVDISSVPSCVFIKTPQVQDAPSSSTPVGYFGGVLWRLGTILWHIDGFSTDT